MSDAGIGDRTVLKPRMACHMMADLAPGHRPDDHPGLRRHAKRSRAAHMEPASIDRQVSRPGPLLPGGARLEGNVAVSQSASAALDPPRAAPIRLMAAILLRGWSPLPNQAHDHPDRPARASPICSGGRRYALRDLPR